MFQKELDKDKKAVVLMTNASQSGQIMTNYTTQFVVNNLYRLGYFGCDIVNIFSSKDANYNGASGVLTFANKVREIESIEYTALLLCVQAESSDGGYVVVLEDMDDISALKDIGLDVEGLTPEYSEVVQTSAGAR